MELEDDLRRLRWTEPSRGVRERILRAARRPSAIPPWFAALERHWLYPGRRPAAAIMVAWLIIVSLRFTTPSLFPAPASASRLNEDDLAQMEIQSAQLFAELRRDEFDADSPPQPEEARRTSLLPPGS